MSVKFFMLQTHYRSTLDFSNEALKASEKGFERLMTSVKTVEKLKPSDESTFDIKALHQKCYDAMNDDFNSPVLIAHLFEGVRIINSINDGKEKISSSDLTILKKIFHDFVFNVLGLKEEESISGHDGLSQSLMDLILEIRKEAKTKKDFQTSDKIRDELIKANITVKDTKEGAVWDYQK